MTSHPSYSIASWEIGDDIRVFSGFERARLVIGESDDEKSEESTFII
jgi:hypothetical protein